MKKILIFIIFIVLGCKDNEETKFLKDQEARKDKNYKNHSIGDAILQLESEKITLLSIIKGVPKDTLHLVLKDYLDETYPLVTDSDKVDAIIENISKKYNISKIKIASIIFSYNYEMLTKDEIEQSAIDREKEN